MFDLARISSYMSLAALVGCAYIVLSSTITRVIDGDTVVLGTGEKARIIGLDTPELRGPECGRSLARLAAERLHQSVKRGDVTIRRLAGREAHHRVLITVTIRGEPMLDVGVREGWARPVPKTAKALSAWC